MLDTNVLLARQPICDRDLNVVAYELLFRPSSPTNGEWDGDAATSQLVLNAFTEVGIENIVGDAKAFINFTEAWLLSPPPFDSKFVTIEVLESVRPTAEIVESVRNLVDLGFAIALDDFIYSDDWIPLLELAEIVKVDVLETSPDELAQTLKNIAPFECTLLAEKVEGHEEFEECKNLGFQLFQGYFFSKPQNVHGAVTETNKASIMQLLSKVQQTNVTMEELEQTISNDIALSTKILKICNSAAYGQAQKIDSLKRAVVLLGLNALRRWTTIIALSKMSDKPSELISMTLQRAKMMELVAISSNLDSHDTCFTVGMFSLVDAFFDKPILEVLEQLPFDSSVCSAILEHEGDIGKLLKCVKFQERGEWDHIDWSFLESIEIDNTKFEKAYLTAVAWAQETMGTLSSGL